MKKSFLLKLIMALIDTAVINIALLAAFYLRFDSVIQSQYIVLYRDTCVVVTLLTLACFYKFNLYNRLWKFASINELISIISATLTAAILIIGYTFMFGHPYPRTIYILYWSLLTTFAGGYRFMLRAGTNINFRGIQNTSDVKNVMVIGAGDAGSVVIEEFVKHPQLKRRPVAVIDDDKSKQGMKIRGIKVEGARKDIPDIVLKKSIHEIIIALPSADRRDIKDIVTICNKTKCKIKILPGIYELIDGNVTVQRLRDVKIEDLLGREPVKVNLQEISGYIKNKTVLVTGGGGSIGSELCRQIVKFKPKQLLIFDMNENDVYNLECDLKTQYRNPKYKCLIGSIRDEDRLEYIFQKYRPEVVFHAAAHKHVPMMELNPIEAIKNNVFGTLNVAEVSIKYSAERFILISTDKAVNPTNVMGATKRIAEIAIQMMARGSNTVFAAVRFGNVLGSKGSVVPLFKRQIERGGPVTVTHPEVTRYFMTIPEAVQLVIQAGALANGGEIFILDMGDPVKIIDLAKNMIRLSGLEPYTDIKIQYTGLRPGEKLFEELLLNEEGITATKNEKIYIAKPTYMPVETFSKELEELKKILLGYNKDLEGTIKRLVPTYKEMLDTSSRTAILN
jgi:FlaA1/EpsC-like NDP-sugar epimerase